MPQYQELREVVKKLWGVNASVGKIVISALGTVTSKLEDGNSIFPDLLVLCPEDYSPRIS